VSDGGYIDGCNNVPDSVQKMTNVSQLGDALSDYSKVEIKVKYLPGTYLWLYYKESKIYSDLRVVIDHLVQSFFQEIVTNAAAVPVIITDSTEQRVIISGNVKERDLSPARLANTIAEMKSQNMPIKIDLNDQGTCYVFYKESVWLSQLRYFPYMQFLILFIFIVIAYIIFSTSRKSEQNRVWVGMSKETAHQLGTPISSLMAWNELLKDSDIDQNIVKEMSKDVNRLETIAQRFSKIGSVPELAAENLIEVIDEFCAYLQTRISSKIKIIINKPKEKELILPLNRYLFEWVIENLCKNSIDSMNGSGSITINIFEPEHGEIVIDITDTGKGIPSGKHKTIFQPGYSSKKRGWGLGLTLAKRIIKEYHKGQLFVKKSQIDVGTTMRIVLKYKGIKKQK
jgi:K+-sensing histidine kinase KdpD